MKNNKKVVAVVITAVAITGSASARLRGARGGCPGGQCRPGCPGRC